MTFRICPPSFVDNGSDAELPDLVLTIEVRDEGDGFDISQLPRLGNSASLLASGRGLILIHAFMDEVSWNECGNLITMKKYFGKKKAPNA